MGSGGSKRSPGGKVTSESNGGELESRKHTKQDQDVTKGLQTNTSRVQQDDGPKLRPSGTPEKKQVDGQQIKDPNLQPPLRRPIQHQATPSDHGKELITVQQRQVKIEKHSEHEKPKQPKLEKAHTKHGKDEAKQRFHAAVHKVRERLQDSRLRVTPVFCGNVNEECPSTAKIVRIFTSSTFTDTSHERAILMKETYPRLKRFCQSKDYEFQVVDMRWGIRSEAADDHMTTDLCLKELELCQKLSTGPNFVTLISHKYGWRSFPPKLTVQDFEKIIQQIDSEETRKLAQKWFEKDDNAVPPMYVLHSISHYMTGYSAAHAGANDAKTEEETNARKANWKEVGEVQDAMIRAAQKVFDAEKMRQFTMSVSEVELLRALQTEEAAGKQTRGKQCVWFKRTITDIEEQRPTTQKDIDLLAKYIECKGDEEKWTETRKVLKKLKDEKLATAFPPKHIYEYNVTWSDKGIDPEKNEHKEYLKKLAHDFEEKLTRMIEDAIEERKNADINDPLFEEVIQHIKFCKDKCESLHGRENELKKIEQYLRNVTNKQGYIVHGVSGSGKTSIMAMAAKKAWDIFAGKAAVVIRFIGTTPDSSNIVSLLSSVTKQIKKIYGISTDVSEDLKELIQEFSESLQMANKSKPLILILDSLDQLDVNNGARELAWLPQQLPVNVRMLVSTLPEPEYECFQKLQLQVTNNENYLPVEDLPDKDVTGIINKWLAIKGRTLTVNQRKILLDAFNQCRLPLFLKLAFDESCRWSSWSHSSFTQLETTVKQAINSLFSRMEVLHGKMLTSRALGYLTAAKTGLSEAELEDILSCDDDVLNDVYQYWTPPVRRLPPLLLVRLKTDLSQYLVDRGADGVQVMYWYHRQFIEVARFNYCKLAMTELLHRGLADFFAGTYANGAKKKSYTDKEGKTLEADRLLVSKPLKEGQQYNIRKLNNLPYHRINAKQCEELKRECLCNFEFMLGKIQEMSLRQLLDDYKLALQEYPYDFFPEDEQLKAIMRALQLSQDALAYYPNQLVPQMLFRLNETKCVEGFLDQCRKSGVPYMMPDQPILTKPGGQLVHCLPGHQGSINAIDINARGSIAVTCGEDETVKLWDVKEGRLIRSFDGLGVEPEKVKFCCNDSIVLATFEEVMVAVTVDAGSVKYKIKINDNDTPFCVGGESKNIIGIFHETSAKLYDATNGALLETVEHPEFGKNEKMSETSMSPPGIAKGGKTYMVVTDWDQYHLTVLDLESKKFLKTKRIFEPFTVPGEEDPEEWEIDAMELMPDEKHVILSTRHDNNLLFYDIPTLELKKTIKGEKDDKPDNFHVTEDGRYLYFPNKSDMCVWDLHQEQRRLAIRHDSSITDVIYANFHVVVSICGDGIVRIWDQARKAQEYSGEKKGIRIGTSVNFIEALPNSRYLVAEVSDGKARSLCVYDVSTQTFVRKRSIDSKTNSAHVLNNEELILITESKKLKRVNINSMEVTKTFKGRLPKYNTELLLVNNGSEVAVLSRGRKYMKIFDLTKEMNIHILKPGQKELIDDIVTNKYGTVVAATTSTTEDDGPLLVLDMRKRKLIRKVYQKELGTDYISTEIVITSDDKFILIPISKVPPGAKNKKDEVLFHIILDLTNGRKVADLVDLEYHDRYTTSENRKYIEIALDKVILLDDKTIISSHDDFIIRMFEVPSGKLLRRLPGHTTSIELHTVENSPYLLSYGSGTDEGVLKIWNKDKWTSDISFTLDKAVSKLQWCRGGEYVLACTQKDPVSIVTWTVCDGLQKSEAKTGVLFGDELKSGYLKLKDPKDDLDEPDDPDTDPEEVSEPDSDEDDDE